MTPDLQREFLLLSAKAEEHLKAVPESGSYRQLFSIWIKPSFAPSSRCTVYTPLPRVKGKQPFAAFTIWRSDLDLEKLRSPVERLKHPKELAPTIEGENLYLAEEDAEEFKKRVLGISIPVVLEPATVGCDGTRFEFSYGAFFHGASLHWWENDPEAWRPFTEVVKAIADELEKRRKAQRED